MEQTGSSPAVLVADDFQTQVDVLYAQILASVDFSIDNNLESACGAKSVTQRPVRKRGASVACSAPVVKDVAVGEKVCCFCEDDIVDVSTTTASTILMSDVNRVCGCSCHLPCAARGSHPEQQQQQQQNSVNTSRECLGAMPRSVSSPQKTACGAYGRSKTGGLVLPRQRQPPSTFGSGRSGMCDSIKKTSAPGPGSYFRGDDEVMRYSVATRSHSKNSPVGGGGGAVGNCGPLGTRHARRSAEDAARALQRQFTLLCQCYWKQFPELGISTNAAAHARNCPCHSIHTASPGGTDSHSSSSRSSCNDASFRVGAKKTSGRRPVVPLTSSPFRVVSPSTKRGAVFGTSPCRAPPAEKQQQQQRSTHTESVEKGPRKGRGPLVRDNTPSRGRPMELASTPGPGAYNVASAFDAASARGKTRSVSIGKAARRLHTPTESPGPGTYDTESKGQTGAQLKNNYFLTTSSRQLQWMAKHDGECSPGPGEYSTENATRTDARHKNSPAFSFGRAKLPVDAKRLVDASAMGKPDEVPGPGTYDVPMMLPDGATVIGGRSAVITTARRDDNMWRGVYYPPDDVPGPGHYVILKETTGPQWTFSTRGLPSVLEEPSPGPGDYSIPIFDVRRGLSATSFFPTAPRLLHEEANRAANLPGPGAYDVEDVAGVTRSAFIGTTQRFFKPESQEEGVPGPGAYVVKHTARERRMAVPILASTAPRFYGCDSVDSRNLIPGPGHYDVVDNMRTLHERGAIIGTASRALTLDTAVATAATDAGPGAYDITLPKDGPSFSMRQRLMDRTVNGDPTPGPGKYDPRELSQGPSAVVGIAARFQSAEEMLCNSVPGPGAYEAALPEKLSATAFFGTSPRFVNNEVVMDEKMGGGLGPGVYDPREARSNIAGAAWGTSPRFFQEEYRDIPGPGAYEVASSSPMRGAVFGNADDKSDWIIPADAANLPGPGSYLPQDAPERMASAVVFGSSPKNALSPEEREAFMQRHIGPGSYDAVLQVPHAFHATFGGADTKRLGEGKPSDTTPGPGQYATTEESQAFVPRGVVFGTASRVPPLQDAAGTPGPGAYVPTLQPNDGSVTGPFSFPTAPRFHGGSEGFGDGNTYDTPGPGSYVLDNAGSQLGGRGAVVFGTEPRIPDYEQRERALFPGPGQYECVQDATTTNGPAYSFGKNPRISMHGNNDDGGFVGGGQAGDVPGPGSYDVVIPTLTAPTTRFGTSNRTVGPLLLSEVPGPGTYDVTKTATVAAASAPAYRFSTAPRESHVDASDTPGPGQYGDSAADGSMWRRFTGASFPTESRFTTGKETDVILPGPGQYSPQHPQWNASQVYSFPSGKKEFFVGNDELPGPGTYNPTISPAGNGIRFGTAERGGEQSAQDGDVPGPGTYDVTLNRQEGSAFSMHRTAPRGPTLVEVEKSYIPGPGTYTLPPAFPATEGAGTGVSFLKAERFKTFDTVVDNVDCVGPLTAPGPGYYDPQLPQSTTGVFIARAPRLVEVGDATAGVTDLPGPGHYEVRRGDPLLTTPLDGGVAMRFTAARFPLRDEATAAEMPGPASYSPVAPQNTTSGASFPHAPRFVLNETQERVEQPGPGEYSLPSAWCPSQDVGYSFGTSKKIEHVYATQDIPGPGSYDTNRYATWYLTGPAFTIQGKSTYKDGHAGAGYPGPGAYSPQPVETARTTTFAPPSTVDPDAFFAARVNATPGPATYAIPATLSSQTVAFGTAPRTLEKTDDLPGPGAYLTSGPIVIPSQPAFSFGHAPRPDIVPQTQNNAPGPGEYHHPIDPGPPVPAFTFAGAERFVEAQAVSTTEPGQYYHPAPASQPRGPSFGFPTTISTMTTAAAAAAGVRAGTGSGLGPGVYFHPSHWDLRERGTSFPVTLGHYPPALGADTPGPGAYHVEPRQSTPLAAMTAQIGVLNTK